MMMFLLILWKMLVLVFWFSVFLVISVFSYFGDLKNLCYGLFGRVLFMVLMMWVMVFRLIMLEVW